MTRTGESSRMPTAAITAATAMKARNDTVRADSARPAPPAPTPGHPQRARAPTSAASAWSDTMASTASTAMAPAVDALRLQPLHHVVGRLRATSHRITSPGGRVADPGRRMMWATPVRDRSRSTTASACSGGTINLRWSMPTSRYAGARRSAVHVDPEPRPVAVRSPTSRPSAPRLATASPPPVTASEPSTPRCPPLQPVSMARNSASLRRYSSAQSPPAARRSTTPGGRAGGSRPSPAHASGARERGSVRRRPGRGRDRGRAGPRWPPRCGRRRP